MSSPNGNDICVWPDGSWCWWSDLEEYGQGKSDDFEVLEEYSGRWENFDIG